MLLSDVCLTSANLSHTSGLSREQREAWRPKWHRGIPTSHVTRRSDTTFKVKKSKVNSIHQASLLSAALTRKVAAAVSVGTYLAWETTATLRCARWRYRRFGAHRGRSRRAGAYRGGRPPTACWNEQWKMQNSERYGMHVNVAKTKTLGENHKRIDDT